MFNSDLYKVLAQGWYFFLPSGKWYRPEMIIIKCGPLKLKTCIVSIFVAKLWSVNF